MAPGKLLILRRRAARNGPPGPAVRGEASKGRPVGAMNHVMRLVGGLALVLVWLVPIAHAADRLTRLNVWDIHIGEAAAKIPDGFINYACGTNGGPPSLPLANFTEFKKCKPDANGLHEVYFEYDDELEYWARALDIEEEIRRWAGTTAYEFPVVASVLFDDAGLAKGVRLVTDPRQRLSRDRREFSALANFIRGRFGDEGWQCRDLPPEEGEHPIGSFFIKNHCVKTANGLRLVLEQRYFRKKGQQAIDPQTGAPRMEDYESMTRFEMYDARLPLRQTGLN
jgi:hypothetical protein